MRISPSFTDGFAAGAFVVGAVSGLASWAKAAALISAAKINVQLVFMKLFSFFGFLQ
jgi:hypothetical protein